uniref:Uncharacterized protein n=1 Tax=Schistocephalus solidus TaxID=70667 RepID=A0A0X3Q1H7_SCHSO
MYATQANIILITIDFVETIEQAGSRKLFIRNRCDRCNRKFINFRIRNDKLIKLILQQSHLLFLIVSVISYANRLPLFFLQLLSPWFCCDSKDIAAVFYVL